MFQFHQTVLIGATATSEGPDCGWEKVQTGRNCTNMSAQPGKTEDEKC